MEKMEKKMQKRLFLSLKTAFLSLSSNDEAAAKVA